MSVERTSATVLDLARTITAAGPDSLAYDGLRVLQHPVRFAAVLARRPELIVPVTVDVWPALSCNARCPSCPYRVSGARDEADRTANLRVAELVTMRAVLDGARAAGVSSVIFTGGGDPLLCPDIVAITRHARSIGLKWGLFTNGIGLTPEFASALLAENPTFLRVSLDAGTARQHALTYGVRRELFERVVDNVSRVARYAQATGSRAFGLAYTLFPSVTARELDAIRNYLVTLRSVAPHGVGLVAFRPRVAHFEREQGKRAPQPFAGCYRDLADEIEARIVAPLSADPRNDVRLDVKRGLFLRADDADIKSGSLSTAWMSTIDHEGVGHLCAELAGAPGATALQWGRIESASDFATAWNSERRLTIEARFRRGELTVPLVHRTSPIDAFLREIERVVPEPIDLADGNAVAQAVGRGDWYRSPNPHLV